jgi:hypothetical protein
MTARPFQADSFFHSATSAAYTSLAPASIIAALGSTIGNGTPRRYITHASVYNLSTSVDTVVRMYIGTRLVKNFAAMQKGGESFTPSSPIPVGFNEAIVFSTAAAASLEFTVQGFNSGT